jgi:hypothetical protein
MSPIDRSRSLFVVAVAAATALWGSSAAPQPQDKSNTSVRRVDRYVHVAAFLNLAQGTVRIVAAVPSDVRSSLGVVDSIASIVRENPSKRLRAYIILTGAESPLQAAVLAGQAPDPRVVYFWDPAGEVAKTWAWDGTACAWLYDTSAKFADPPPQASLTVTAKKDGKPYFQCDALRAMSNDLVRRVEAKVEASGTE